MAAAGKMLGFAVHAWSVLVVALVLIWLVNGRHGFGTQVADYPFNYHPLFMVLAFLGLETQGAQRSLYVASHHKHAGSADGEI
jgi:uncharacterized membrane protein